MPSKAKHKQAFERASKPAPKPLGKYMCRMVALCERLDGRLVSSIVRRWESLLLHIPAGAWNTGDNRAKKHGDRIACFIPLLAVLDPDETAGILKAIEGAILNGTFSGHASKRTEYELVRLPPRGERANADLLRRVIGQVRYEDPALGLAGCQVEEFIEAMRGLRPGHIDTLLRCLVSAADQLRASRDAILGRARDDDDDADGDGGDDDGDGGDDDGDDDDDGDGYDGWLEPARPPRKG